MSLAEEVTRMSATMTMTALDVALDESDSDDGEQHPLIFFGGVFLLFLLLAGISASVDTELFKEVWKEPWGVGVGLACQVFILPLLAFASVNAMGVNETTTVALLITCMSPGGAFSNWFCSVFNADLALSIAMTTTSTVLAVAVLPFNMYLYIEVFAGADVTLDWVSLIISVVSAAAGLMTGLAISRFRPQWRRICGRIGTAAGIVLIIYGAITSTTRAPFWDREAFFYIGVMLPCLVGLVTAHILARLIRLSPPMAMAIGIECGYQNTGIAMSIVIATFSGSEQAEALGVPLYYAFIQAVVLVPYCVLCWKLGYSHAPPDTPVLTMLRENFQPTSDDPKDDDDEERVDSSPDGATVTNRAEGTAASVERAPSTASLLPASCPPKNSPHEAV